jgi:hypothetical protein
MSTNKREICEIVSGRTGENDVYYTVDGRFVRDENGRVIPVPTSPETADMMDNLMREKAYVLTKETADGYRLVSVWENPTGWFQNLPRTFHGTFFYARMIDEEALSEADRASVERTVFLAYHRNDPTTSFEEGHQQIDL